MKPQDYIEIFLAPGEFYFGGRDTRIRTLLGSCVAICMWHPQRHIGGMCHYMLPRREHARTGSLDGRYADEAMQMFLNEIRKSGTRPGDYQVKLFGGGNMFPRRAGTNLDVATRNVQAGRELVRTFGFNLVNEHLGGQGHRNVIFDVWSGDVWLKHQPLPAGEAYPVIGKIA